MPNNQKIVVKDAAGRSTEIEVRDDFTSLLTELKTLLGQSKAKEFQYADKIYNIASINEANFGFLTGNTTFNETLTKRLVEALKPHDNTAKNIAQKIDDIGASTIGRVQDFLTEIFVGVIGRQLFKLFGIGKDSATEINQRNYIEKCIFITKRSFDLINFALLSELWEVKRDTDIKFTDAQVVVLDNRFESTIEYSIPEEFELLRTLHEIFSKNALPLPVSELGPGKENKVDLTLQMQEGSELHTVCLRLHALGEKGKAKYDILDCYEAETQLASLLGHFYFLIHYRMVSIKGIDYRQIRNLQPFYLHNYASLGVEENSAKINYSPEAVHTHAVLLYRGDNYKESINLFPFVIDYNTLAVEDGTNTCFFNSREFRGKGLSFLCMEDESMIKIERKGAGLQTQNMNDFLIEKDNRKTFNLDCVAEQFQAARDCLLGAERDQTDQ